MGLSPSSFRVKVGEEMKEFDAARYYIFVNDSGAKFGDDVSVVVNPAVRVPEGHYKVN